MKTLIFNLKTLENSTSASAAPATCFLVIENGIIKEIGQTFSVAGLATDESFSTIIDGHGLLVLPGLIDSHIHVGMMGESMHYVNLADCHNIIQLRDRVRAKAENEPDLPFIIGINWDQTKLKVLPTRFDLDDITTKPVFLWRACWHIGVVNTAALQLAQLFRPQSESPTVEGGSIDFAKENANTNVNANATTYLDENEQWPTGILRERAVEPLIGALAVHKTPSMTRQFLREGLDLCVRNGITTVQTNDERCLEVYRALQAEELLPIRILLTPNQSELEDLIVTNQAPIPLFNADHSDAMYFSSRLGMNRVKIFSDGSLGAETAAIRLHSPDSASAQHKGILIHSSSAMEKMIIDSGRAGYRVEIHAIGDAATEQVLAAMKHTKDHQSNSTALHRPILTHCQVLGEDLVVKMKELDVIANVQPYFVPTDMRWVTERMSPEQSTFSYAWKTLLTTGIHVAGGSDAPIEHPSPFTGMYDAIFRTNAKRLGTDHNNPDAKVFRPEECLSFAEALRIYTEEGAFAAGYEHALGRLAVGFAADLVLIDSTVWEDHSRLHGLKPRLVVVGGQVVYVEVDEEALIVREAREFHDQRQRWQLGSSIESDRNQPQLSETPFISGKGGYHQHRSYDGRMGYCRCLLHMQYCGV